MFFTVRLYPQKVLPKISLSIPGIRIKSMHQNRIYLDEMPESLKRDLGLLDGRARRGAGAREASAGTTRLVQWQRGL
jgi:hypothetical protein